MSTTHRHWLNGSVLLIPLGCLWPAALILAQSESQPANNSGHQTVFLGSKETFKQVNITAEAPAVDVKLDGWFCFDGGGAKNKNPTVLTARTIQLMQLAGNYLPEAINRFTGTSSEADIKLRLGLEAGADSQFIDFVTTSASTKALTRQGKNKVNSLAAVYELAESILARSAKGHQLFHNLSLDPVKREALLGGFTTTLSPDPGSFAVVSRNNCYTNDDLKSLMDAQVAMAKSVQQLRGEAESILGQIQNLRAKAEAEAARNQGGKQ